MLNLLSKTKFLFILQLLLYISVPFVYWFLIQLAISINAAWFSNLPLNIALPGLIIVSLGLASMYSLWIVAAIAWYVNQALVVAATVIVNGLSYKGSLTIYSFSEVNKSLLIFSTKSLISRKTFQLLKTIKNSLLDKEIMQGLFNHRLVVVRKAAGLLRNNMSNTLDYADEILVSHELRT